MLKLANPIGSKARCNHEEVFVRQYDRLLESALRLTQGDRQLAEDLVQEAFVQFTFTRPDLDSIKSVEGYLYGMLRNLHLMDLRRATHRRNEPLALVDFDSIDIGLRSRDLSQAIQTKNELSLICRYACQRKKTSKAGSVLILRFFHGYYPSEIAQVIQSSRAVVSELLLLARTEARRFTEDPSSLVFMGESNQSHPLSIQAGLSYVHILNELRSSIFRSASGPCLSEVELESIYQTSRPAPVDGRVLDHLVSCVECLDSVNKMLKLPLLADRNPADMLSPNRAARRDGSDGPKGPDDPNGPGDGGSHLEEVRQKCRRRARRVFEHEPRELCVSVNGDRQFWQRIGSECSEQAFSLEATDDVEVIEVSSEQGIRLLLMQVDQRVEQTAEVELSEGRTLRVSLDQRSSRPRLLVSYLDPNYAAVSHSSRDLNSATSNLEDARDSWLHKLQRFFKSTKPLLRAQLITGFAIIVIGAGLLVYRFSGPSPNRSVLLAPDLLQRGILAEQSFLARTDTVLHRSIKVERKELIGSAVGQVTQHRIEIWHSTEKGLTARRLFDQQQRLVAGLWQRKDGVEVAYQHGKAPELKLTSKDPRQRISPVNFWYEEPTADTFRRMVGNPEALSVEELASTYLISYAPRQPSETQIVKASLVLAKADLHVTEMTLIVKEADSKSSQAATVEYHFTESSFEKHSPSTISESTFEPERELLSSDPGRVRRVNSLLPGTTIVEPPPPRVVATADLEVELLRLLHEVGADLGEQVIVTKTRDGFLRVSGVVETEQRRAEILTKLRPVIDSHVATVELETVAEALTRQKLPQPKSDGPVIESVTRPEALTMPVEDDLHRYFSSQGDRADEATRQFAMRMVTHSRKAMVHIYAIKRLLRQFSVSEFGELSVDARVKWLGLLQTHARAFKTENDLMRADLRPVFFAEQNLSNGEQATRIDVASAITTAEQLVTLATENDRVVRYSFNTTSETVPQQTVKSREFWSAMEQASRLTLLIAESGL